MAPDHECLHDSELDLSRATSGASDRAIAAWPGLLQYALFVKQLPSDLRSPFVGTGVVVRLASARTRDGGSADAAGLTFADNPSSPDVFSIAIVARCDGLMTLLHGWTHEGVPALQSNHATRCVCPQPIAGHRRSGRCARGRCLRPEPGGYPSGHEPLQRQPVEWQRRFRHRTRSSGRGRDGWVRAARFSLDLPTPRGPSSRQPGSQRRLDVTPRRRVHLHGPDVGRIGRTRRRTGPPDVRRDDRVGGPSRRVLRLRRRRQPPVRGDHGRGHAAPGRRVGGPRRRAVRLLVDDARPRADPAR